MDNLNRSDDFGGKNMMDNVYLNKIDIIKEKLEQADAQNRVKPHKYHRQEHKP